GGARDRLRGGGLPRRLLRGLLLGEARGARLLERVDLRLRGLGLALQGRLGDRPQALEVRALVGDDRRERGAPARVVLGPRRDRLVVDRRLVLERLDDEAGEARDGEVVEVEVPPREHARGGDAPGSL